MSRPLTWQLARLVETRLETATAKTLVLQVDDWPGHIPGQHVDLRLTAEDGYSTQRSYSIASGPDKDTIELTVQLLADGEVSPFLFHDLAVGDRIELRGPIGGWFVWDPEEPRSALLVGGGSGVVPLMAMLRSHSTVPNDAELSLIYSVRTPDDVYYRDELLAPTSGTKVSFVYTRRAPDASHRQVGRLTAADIPTTALNQRAYICGPTAFVEFAAQLLLQRGYNERQIRTERFGPSGG